MQRIVVLNPKGGSGKTTVASNLAACYAANGERPALMDLDPQGSSMRWLRKRPDDAPPIHGIAAFERSGTVTRSWQMRVPADCGAVIIDTPAAIDPHALSDITRGVDAVLVPRNASPTCCWSPRFAARSGVSASSPIVYAATRAWRSR